MNLKAIFRSLPLSIIALLLVVGVLYATTTIGTNISTDGNISAVGTLDITGASTLRSTVTLTNADQKFSPGYGLDTSAAGDLNIGTTTATTINIGNSTGAAAVNIAAGTGGITITGAINGASPFSFEGASANSSETTLAVTDPTADRTITFQDVTGTIPMSIVVGSSGAVDFGSVANTACTADSANITATGAVLGDRIVLSSGTALEVGSFLIGRVTAADTVRFQFCNLSGGAIDRASDTYSVQVIR